MERAALRGWVDQVVAGARSRRAFLGRISQILIAPLVTAPGVVAKKKRKAQGKSKRNTPNARNKRDKRKKRRRRGDSPPGGPDRSFSTPAPGADFVAFYTKLDSGEEWERVSRTGPYADLWVNLGQDERLVFWRASSYLPRWETEQGGTDFDPVLPREGDGPDARWDTFNRHSHVRLIESSAEQIVVHWRYAPRFETRQRPRQPGWTGWVDEYFTVRPDRTVTRVIYDYDAGTVHTFQLRLQADGAIATDSSTEEPFARPGPASNSALALPTGPDRGFGASYTNLGYSGPWHHDDAPSEQWNDVWQVGEHPDVVVDFDGNATKWVFWRGTNFVAHVVSENGVWYTNEFNETWERDHMESDGAEPMSDKQNRYAHVRILESTPVRARVHYRYALVDNFYNLVWRNGSPLGWADWADFYYTIYPDGVTVQENVIWSQGAANGEAHEFQETIVVHSSGRTPADNIDTNATVTLANLAGKSKTYGWSRKRYGGKFKKPPQGANIQLVKLKGSGFQAFTVVQPGKSTGIRPYDDPISRRTPGAFTWWNHWPVNVRNVFGNDARDASEPSHTSLTHMFWPFHAKGHQQATKLLLMGLSPRSAGDIARLGRSWLKAPGLGNLSANLEEATYDPAQRAYVLARKDAGDDQPLSFVVNASAASPLVNACFVVRDWKSDVTAHVSVDGDAVDVAQGLVHDTNGRRSLLVWVEHESSQPVEVTIGA